MLNINLQCQQTSQTNGWLVCNEIHIGQVYDHFNNPLHLKIIIFQQVSWSINAVKYVSKLCMLIITLHRIVQFYLICAKINYAIYGRRGSGAQRYHCKATVVGSILTRGNKISLRHAALRQDTALITATQHAMPRKFGGE